MWSAITLAIIGAYLGWWAAGTPVPQKKKGKALFKTNDGVQMFIGDRYWYIADARSHPGLKIYSVKICSEQDCCKGFCQFSTLEKAEEQLCFYSDDRENGEV